MAIDTSRGSWPKILVVAFAILALGAAIGWSAGRFSGSASALSMGERRAIEGVVRDYLIANPEVLPEAMDALQRKQASSALSGIRGDVETPFPGAVMGNPRGSKTLVEFTDYACGYCRQSVAHVKALMQSDPQVKIVVRELPILSAESETAARMALAAAEQGKYTQFHDAMFAAGRPGTATIEAAARTAGLDLDKARQTMRSDRVSAELAKNLELARQLGFNGTPSWVAGDQLLSGAVDADRLAQLLDGDAG